MKIIYRIVYQFKDICDMYRTYFPLSILYLLFVCRAIEKFVCFRKAKANRERLIEKRMNSLTKTQRQAPVVDI